MSDNDQLNIANRLKELGKLERWVARRLRESASDGWPGMAGSSLREVLPRRSAEAVSLSDAHVRNLG